MAASEKDIKEFLQAKKDCLDLSLNSGNFFSDNNSVCPTEWDGYMCWHSTKPGESATASCPKISGSSAVDKVVTRLCTVDGRWEDILDSVCKADEESTTLLATLSIQGNNFNSTEDIATTTAAMNSQTVPDFVDDGIVMETTVTHPTTALDFVTTTSAIFTTTQTSVTSIQHGGYIYDYYNQIDVIRALINCLSVILLVTAISFWYVIWCRSRYGHPYRCVSLICILVFSLLYHSVGVITLLVYVPEGLGCQCVLTLKSYGDVGMYTFCFLYVILCIGIAMRRLESGKKFYLLIILAAILPLILVTSTTAIRVWRHPDSNCKLLDELAHYLWSDRIPKTFLLFGTICVLAVILYWLFCFDNTLFKLNRDYLLIRHSSVTLMILVCYCFFLELYEVLFLRNTIDGQIKSPAVARNGLILNILMSIKGALAATLLCFFDIEIFSLIYSFPCCPDLGNAIIDQSWEKRIRSESKVKFFEDSSSDDQSKKSPVAKLQENQKVLAQPQAIQGYGTVDDHDPLNP